MHVINFFGGPGSGKSSTSAALFYHLKGQKVKTELVGEFAKELIYRGNENQLINQVYILGCQYRKLKDLERHGIQLAISDSPLLLQKTYGKINPYYNELVALVSKLNEEFENVNIFLERKKDYQQYGRTQTEEEARELDREIFDSVGGKFDYIITGDASGTKFIQEEMVRNLLNFTS
jgi:NAD-dependent DNA ligase